MKRLCFIKIKLLTHGCYERWKNNFCSKDNMGTMNILHFILCLQCNHCCCRHSHYWDVWNMYCQQTDPQKYRVFSITEVLMCRWKWQRIWIPNSSREKLFFFFFSSMRSWKPDKNCHMHSQSQSEHILVKTSVTSNCMDD